MKIIVMKCKDRSLWYGKKIGKTYTVIAVKGSNYSTKEGDINIKDCEVIEE